MPESSNIRYGLTPADFRPSSFTKSQEVHRSLTRYLMNRSIDGKSRSPNALFSSPNTFLSPLKSAENDKAIRAGYEFCGVGGVRGKRESLPGEKGKGRP